MRRFILPLIGILAAAWAAYAIVHTTTHRESTIPPSPPPVSDFRDTVAAVGLVEASTENIAIGTPLSGIVPKVFVGAGDAVRAGDPRRLAVKGLCGCGGDPSGGRGGAGGTRRGGGGGAGGRPGGGCCAGTRSSRRPSRSVFSTPS